MDQLRAVVGACGWYLKGRFPLKNPLLRSGIVLSLHLRRSLTLNRRYSPRRKTTVPRRLLLVSTESDIVLSLSFH